MVDPSGRAAVWRTSISRNLLFQTTFKLQNNVREELQAQAAFKLQNMRREELQAHATFKLQNLLLEGCSRIFSSFLQPAAKELHFVTYTSCIWKQFENILYQIQKDGMHREALYRTIHHWKQFCIEYLRALIIVNNSDLSIPCLLHVSCIIQSTLFPPFPRRKKEVSLLVYRLFRTMNSAMPLVVASSKKPKKPEKGNSSTAQETKKPKKKGLMSFLKKK